jgi:gliding motility-associated-like protein
MRGKSTFQGIIFALFILGFFSEAKSQCGANTPVYKIDLSGKPDSSWLSPLVVRNDTCCGGATCIEFIITLDTLATGINLSIYSGAVPTGALYYNVNCGTATTIGTPLCLSGKGPHKITFCKPGGNANVYQIQSIRRPHTGKPTFIRDGCIGTLSVTGMIDSTVTWHSATNNSVYDSYLSCASGCSSTNVTAKSGRPAYVDYIVCGRPISNCGTTICDTVRAYFIYTLKTQINPDTPTICNAGGSVKLTANASGGKIPYKYLWNTGATTQSIVATGGGTYWVSVSDSTNCPPVTDTDVVKAVTYNISANAGNDTSICSGMPAKLNGKVVTATGGYWYGGSGTFNPGRTALNALYTPSAGELLAGKFTLVLATTGNGACQGASDTVVIKINPTPFPAITGKDSVCQNTANQTYITKLNAGSQYDWSAVGALITGGTGTSAITVKWGSSATGKLTVIETNASGCSALASKTVNLISKPVLSISGLDNICENNTGTYSTAAQAGISYTWSASGGSMISASNANPVSVHWGNVSPGTVFLKGVNLSGCDTTISKPVTIIVKPKPTISGPLTACEFVSVNNYSVVPQIGHTYSWQVTGGKLLNGDFTPDITVNWGAAGTGRILLKETNEYGCDTTISIAIRIQGLPKPKILGKDSICQFSPIEYYSTGSNQGSNYTWKVTGGSLVAQNDPNVVSIDWGKSGTGTVQVTEITKLGCDSTVKKVIVILPKPIPGISGPDTVCANSVNQIYYSARTQDETFEWKVTGGVINGRTDSSSVSITWGNSTAGNIMLHEVNTAGCDTTIQQKVSIFPHPSPLVNGPDIACTHTGVYSTPYNTGNKYYWTVTNGSITFTNQNQVGVKWNTQGTGTITVKEVNAFGCDSTASKTVQFETLKLTIQANQTYNCAPALVNFSYAPDSDFVNQNWDFGDGETSNDIQPGHYYNKPGNYKTRLIAQSKLGCFDTAYTSQMIVYQNPIAKFDMVFPRTDKLLFIHDDTLKLFNKSQFAAKYLWQLGDSDIYKTINVKKIWDKPGEYLVKLYAYNTNGCVDSAIEKIYVGAHVSMFIPNVFSPNGDKHNDMFFVKTTNIIKFHIAIFNRWGENVYSSDDKDFVWDGTFKGELVPEGVYIYVIKAQDILDYYMHRNGNITILR